MKYLLMIHGDEQVWADLPEEAQQQVMVGLMEFESALKGAGKFIETNRLDPPRTA